MITIFDVFIGTNNGNGNGGPNPPNPATNGNNSPNGSNGGSNNNSSAKIEQLNSMREALYSQDGWGGVSITTNKTSGFTFLFSRISNSPPDVTEQ